MHTALTTRPLLLVALAFGLPLGLAACSGTSSSTATTSGGGTTASTAATTRSFSCTGAPASAVNAALGTSIGAPTTQTNGSVTVCTYHSTSPIQTVIVRADTGSSAATFAVRKGTTESR